VNSSFAYLSLGEVRRTRTDLVWCRRVATDEGHHLIAAKALHNLGYCDLLAGDIPAALQLFNVAANAYRLSDPGFLLVLAADEGLPRRQMRALVKISRRDRRGRCLATQWKKS